MNKLILVVVGFAIFVGLIMPSDKPSAPAANAAQAKPPGLFEAAPYKVTELRRRPNGHFYVTADVNGAPINFVVDTGASSVALTEADARAAGIQFSSAEYEPIARTANGIARGKAITLPKVSIEGKDVTEVEGMILEGSDVSLLGQSYLSRISGVEMSGDYMTLR